MTHVAEDPARICVDQPTIVLRFGDVHTETCGRDWSISGTLSTSSDHQPAHEPTRCVRDDGDHRRLRHRRSAAAVRPSAGPADRPGRRCPGGRRRRGEHPSSSGRPRPPGGRLAADQRCPEPRQRHGEPPCADPRGVDGSNAGQRIAVYGYGATTWGENVAAGQTTAGEVVDAWMRSSGHRANILRTDWINVGVAATKGSNGVMYWALVFAA